MASTELEKYAQSLWDARTQQKAIAPITEQNAEISLAQAYEISQINFKKRLQAGERSLGRKIGLTSRAVQKQLGVFEPDFGYLSSAMNISCGEKVNISSLLQPKVEGEVAFFLKKDLSGPGISAAQVISATEFVLPCIEIIDSRIADWKIKIQDTVADNASSALFVLGNTPRSLGRADLRMAGMTLRLNGEVASTGMGMACLDHPVNAVAWLANKLGSLGDGLKAGDIILSGAYGPVVPVKAGDKVEVDIHGLGGPVYCSF